MADVEVHIPLGEATLRVVFEYHSDWLGHDTAFSLEPVLQLGRGAFAPTAGVSIGPHATFPSATICIDSTHSEAISG